MGPPLVTAVMVTGGKTRAWWAARSLRAFLQQTYTPRELVIVNESDATDWRFSVTSALPELPPDVQVRELHFDFHEHPLGTLRNIAKSEAAGEWIIQWDDDDWAHPERISLQMQYRREEHAQTLLAQVRYSTELGTAFSCSDPSYGISGTILHPRTDFLYPAQRNHEDSAFLLSAWAGRIVVLDNLFFPHLYLRFLHGDNLTHLQRGMREFADKKWRSRWPDVPEQRGWLSRAAAGYTRTVLQDEYGFSVPADVWSDVLADRGVAHPSDNPQVRGLCCSR